MGLSSSIADLFSDTLPTGTGGSSTSPPPGSGISVAGSKGADLPVILLNSLRQAVELIAESVDAMSKDLHMAAFNSRHNDHHLFYMGLALLGPTALEPTDEAQITADTNDWVVVEAATWHRISSDAARVITGMVAATSNGALKILTNVGAFDITFNDTDAASAVANQIITGTGAPVVLGPDQSLMFIYDQVTGAWRTF